MDEKNNTRLCYCTAAAIAVLLLFAVFYMWHRYAVIHTGKNTFTPTRKRVPKNPPRHGEPPCWRAW